jgi:hypothetical protein
VSQIAVWNDYIIDEPIPVTARSKAWVCGQLFDWDCELESNRVHPFLYLLCVVFCHLKVSASGWSFVRRSLTECGVSDCDLEDPWHEATIQLGSDINYGDVENWYIVWWRRLSYSPWCKPDPFYWHLSWVILKIILS